MARLAGSTGLRPACDGGRLAAEPLPAPLGRPECKAWTWTAEGCQGDQGPDLQDVGGQPDLGLAPDPRRAAEAWHRGRQVHGRGLHGQTAQAFVAHLADLPGEPRRGPRQHRLLHRADGEVHGPVRLPGARSPPSSGGPFQRHHEPDDGLDRATGRRGVPLGRGSPIPVARPRQRLRLLVSAAGEEHWHRGGGHRRPFAVAVPLRGATDREYPARVFGPRHRLQRRALGARAWPVHRLLQVAITMLHLAMWLESQGTSARKKVLRLPGGRWEGARTGRARQER